MLFTTALLKNQGVQNHFNGSNLLHLNLDQLNSLTGNPKILAWVEIAKLFIKKVTLNQVAL